MSFGEPDVRETVAELVEDKFMNEITRIKDRGVPTLNIMFSDFEPDEIHMWEFLYELSEKYNVDKTVIEDKIVQGSSACDLADFIESQM